MMRGANQPMPSTPANRTQIKGPLTIAAIKDWSDAITSDTMPVKATPDAM